jgi:protein SCO1/2
MIKNAFLILAVLWVAGLVRVSADPPFSGGSIYQVGGAWIDDAGQPMSLAELRGRPVVIAMFYTRCGFACPLIVAQMQRIRAALPEAERARTSFVLVSFDSKGDSVADLRAYRNTFRLPVEGWTLLRGPADDVRNLAMALGFAYTRDSRGQYTHSTQITVLNSGGEIVLQQKGLNGDINAMTAAVAAHE